MSAYEEIMQLQRKLNNVIAAMESLKDQQEHIRMDIANIVQAAGGEYKLDGLATYKIVDDSERISYDRNLLDDLAEKCREHGYGWMADKIHKCRKTTTYSGGLRIYPVRSSS